MPQKDFHEILKLKRGGGDMTGPVYVNPSIGVGGYL
jgi:hypothetical protein